MDVNLWTMFSAVAKQVPSRDAIVHRRLRRTYSDVAARAAGFASFLAAEGLGWHQSRTDLPPWCAGQDLVGLYLRNSPEYLEATLGCFAARTAPFNVNYRYTDRELAYLLNDARATVLVYQGAFAPVVRDVLPLLDRQPLLIHVDDDSGQPHLPGAVNYEEACHASDRWLDELKPSPDDLYVVYTGGTTGMPKGTLWRQEDLFRAALGGQQLPIGDEFGQVVRKAAEDGAGGRLLPSAPFIHSAGHWNALYCLLFGGTVVINNVVDRFDPADAWQLVQDEAIDTMLMIGEAFARPCLAELENGHYDTTSVRFIVMGGAVTTRETKQRLLQHLPHAIVIDAAGASETGGALSQISRSDSVAAAGVFDPLVGTCVLNETCEEVLTAGHDGVGWLARRGHIPLGYLNDQAKTERTFPVIGGDRFVVPGDRARVCSDGLIELLGRDSGVINTGGEKVFAEEVELALMTHPAVDDVVVVGRPNRRWGDEVVAVLAVRDDVSDEELLAAVGKRLARYKLPKLIVRVPKVFRSPAGKLDYAWARARVDLDQQSNDG